MCAYTRLHTALCSYQRSWASQTQPATTIGPCLLTTAGDCRRERQGPACTRLSIEEAVFDTRCTEKKVTEQSATCSMVQSDQRRDDDDVVLLLHTPSTETLQISYSILHSRPLSVTNHLSLADSSTAQTVNIAGHNKGERARRQTARVLVDEDIQTCICECLSTCAHTSEQQGRQMDTKSETTREQRRVGETQRTRDKCQQRTGGVKWSAPEECAVALVRALSLTPLGFVVQSRVACPLLPLGSRVLLVGVIVLRRCCTQPLTESDDVALLYTCGIIQHERR